MRERPRARLRRNRRSARGRGKREKGAARIGVDLDEFRTLGRQMEVVAHEGACRAVIDARDRRRPGEDGFLIRRQSRNGFDGMDNRLHGVAICVGQKDRRV
jgi:hypothetical protein